MLVEYLIAVLKHNPQPSRARAVTVSSSVLLEPKFRSSPYNMSVPPLDRKCFLPLSDINLPSAFTLHPNSANPCHDLVALYRPLSDAEISANEPHVPAFLQARMAQQAAKEKADSFLPSMVKGKQKESNTKQKMRVGLWRAFSGVHVWDVEVTGNAILALAWSLDGMSSWLLRQCRMTIFNSRIGLYLSLLTRVSYGDTDDEPGLRLVHLSVQDGSLVHMVPLNVAPGTAAGVDTLDMEWCESDLGWPTDAVSVGSGVPGDASAKSPITENRKVLPG